MAGALTSSTTLGVFLHSDHKGMRLFPYFQKWILIIMCILVS